MRRYFITLLLTTGLFVLPALADTIQHIRIEGNKRIEPETIISYMPLKVGDTYSETKVNEALKDLYATGYFVDVHIVQEGNSLVVKVMENAMINRIAYEGNSKVPDDKLKEEVQLRPREVLSQAKIRTAQQRILDIYRRMGRFGAKVEPKIIAHEENRVDLVFEIDEGEVAYIRKINFVGNKHISSSKLENAVLSRKARWYRFFASDDVFDNDRLEADKQALRQHYLNSGFPDFRLISAVAELSPDGKDFYLTFTIDEGERYTFGAVELVSEVSKIKSEDYTDLVEFREGETFSAKKIEKAITKITEAIGAHGYAFATVEPNFDHNRQQKIINTKFVIKEGAKVYVERIEIIGNDRTRDHVIRRELQLHEGDAYNTTLIRKSEKNIRDLGYFKRVDVVARQGSAPDKALLIVKVEEQPTGEMNIAGGYGTVDGLLAKVGFSERNFMGKGQIVGADLSVARKYQEFTIGITEPYFLDKPLSLGGTAFATRSNRFSTYTHMQKGVHGSVGYNITEDLSHTVTYSVYQDRVYHLEPGTSTFVKAQAGTSFTSSLGHTLTYDRRDSKIDPTTGYVASLNNVYAGLGGNVFYLRSVVSGNYYYTPIEDVTLILKGSVGRIDKVNRNFVRVVDSFQLGADTLRGFEYGGVGPRATDGSKDSIGGTRFWTIAADLVFPIGLPNELGIKGATFIDIGDLWKHGFDNRQIFVNIPGNPLGFVPATRFIEDPRKVRVTIGVGVSWASPFGPLRVDVSQVLRKAKQDIEQRVLFGFSTRF